MAADQKDIETRFKNVGHSRITLYDKWQTLTDAECYGVRAASQDSYGQDMQSKGRSSVIQICASMGAEDLRYTSTKARRTTVEWSQPHGSEEAL